MVAPNSATGNGRRVKNTAVGGESPTNGGAEAIAASEPYTAFVRLTGTADLLFHRWNVEAVAEKAAAAKGSKSKKSDNVESYVYRDEAGIICLPGEYLRGSILGAAKFLQDPRSPRKSAVDLYKAGIAIPTALAPLGKPTWDYEHAARVQVQRNGVTRVRPALKAGWTAAFEVLVLIPEYIGPDQLHAAVANAGRLIGVGDFRPTYGRFRIDSFEVATPK